MREWFAESLQTKGTPMFTILDSADPTTILASADTWRSAALLQTSLQKAWATVLVIAPAPR